MRELVERVWSNPAFHDAAARVQRAWIARETGAEVGYRPDLETAAKVIRAAAILACSADGEHRRASFRAATSVYELYGADALPFDQALRVVLGRLGNFPSMMTRKQVATARPAMSVRLISEEMAAADAHTVTCAGESVILTPFQHDLWRRLRAGERLATAAPTSAGKSFVLQRFLAATCERSGPVSVAYLVPTRALIAQVSRDMRVVAAGAARIAGEPTEIVTVPIEGAIQLPSRAIFVMTQERMQLTLGSHGGLAPEVAIIDEAHGIADGSRGVLLQRVVDEFIRRRPGVQLLFASPGIRNLDVFGRALGLGDVRPLRSEEPTVAQNFLLVRVRDSARGLLELLHVQEGVRPVSVANFDLGRRIGGRADRLVNAAATLGRGATNIIYANGAGDAESIAIRLAKRLGGRETTPGREALARLAREAVHKTYALADCARVGVAFHYSNMPTLLRMGVERAVAEGDVDHLVCTSTLLQGVNLPAKNVFMCRPEKGDHVPLEPVDFWNLAGRAGRLLKEFQGNIFLIDYDDWRRKPLGQPRDAPVVPAVERAVVSEPRRLLSAMNPAFRNAGDDPDLESVFVHLLSKREEGSLDEALSRMAVGERGIAVAGRIGTALEAAATAITLPMPVIRRSPDISALKQQRLYEAFAERLASRAEAASLVPLPPGDPAAYESHAAALGLCHELILGRRPGSRLHRFHALVALWWMRGRPLPQIVQNQLERNPATEPRLEIRRTLKLVERDVRHQCVRLFNCYNAVLAQALGDHGLHELAAALPPLPLFLEIGASSRTMVGLVALGLSRLTATRLAEVAPGPDLDQAGLRRWLLSDQAANVGLSPALLAEVEEIRTALR